MPSADLGDHPVDRHRGAVGHPAVERDDVVELQGMPRRDGDPELERGRIVGSEYQPDGVHPPILECASVDRNRPPQREEREWTMLDAHGNPMSGDGDTVAAYDELLDRMVRFHPDLVPQAMALVDSRPTRHRWRAPRGRTST